jgi:hypothetical protein
VQKIYALFPVVTALEILLKLGIILVMLFMTKAWGLPHAGDFFAL